MTVWRSQIANFSPLGTWGESLPLSDLQPWVCRDSPALPLPLAARSTFYVTRASFCDVWLEKMAAEIERLLAKSVWTVSRRPPRSDRVGRCLRIRCNRVGSPDSEHHYYDYYAGRNMHCIEEASAQPWTEVVESAPIAVKASKRKVLERTSQRRT